MYANKNYSSVTAQCMTCAISEAAMTIFLRSAEKTPVIYSSTADPIRWYRCLQVGFMKQWLLEAAR